MDLDDVRPWNVHWTTGHVSELVLKHATPRRFVPKLVETLLDSSDKSWSLRPGPRQVGKTTGFGHAMQTLMDKHDVDPKRIAFVPLDQDAVLKGTQGRLADVFETLLKLRAASRSEPMYVFLDEIQEFPEWPRALKACWDRYHATFRVAATGSSALALVRPPSADFHGRIRTTRVFPMKFSEILEAHPGGAKVWGRKGWRAVRGAAKAARGSLVKGRNAAASSLEALHAQVSSSDASRSFVRATFLEYCLWGGYPAVRPGCGLSGARRLDYLDAAWGTIVAKDLTSVGTGRIREFTNFFHALARGTGGKFVAHKHATSLGVKSDTVTSWKRVLEDLLLVQQLPPLKPGLTIDRGPDKAYLVDPAWYALASHETDHTTLIDTPEIGKLVETVLVDHVRRMQFGEGGTTALSIGYVSKPEVDVVAQLGRAHLLIESKHRARETGLSLDVGRPGDLRLTAGGDRFQAPKGRGTIVLPAYELALLA